MSYLLIYGRPGLPLDLSEPESETFTVWFTINNTLDTGCRFIQVPTTHIALPLIIITNRNDSSAGLETDCMLNLPPPLVQHWLLGKHLVFRF